MVIQINNLKFNIRQCVGSDYRFCYNLSKKNMLPYIVRYWGGWNPQAYKKAFVVKNIKVVEYKSKRIGFYNLVIKGYSAYLNDVQVSGLMRGRGLGTKLLELMEKEAKSQGVKKIGLRVFKDNPSKSLYSRIGYKEVEDCGHSVVMEKTI